MDHFWSYSLSPPSFSPPSLLNQTENPNRESSPAAAASFTRPPDLRFHFRFFVCVSFSSPALFLVEGDVCLRFRSGALLSGLGFSVAGVAWGRLLPASGSVSVWCTVTGNFPVTKTSFSEHGGACCTVKRLVGLVSLLALSGGEWGCVWCWGYGLAGFRLCRLLSAYSEDPPSSSPVVVARRVSSVVVSLGSLSVFS